MKNTEKAMITIRKSSKNTNYNQEVHKKNRQLNELNCKLFELSLVQKEIRLKNSKTSRFIHLDIFRCLNELLEKQAVLSKEIYELNVEIIKDIDFFDNFKEELISLS